jgi:hypothetical protein
MGMHGFFLVIYAVLADNGLNLKLIWQKNLFSWLFKQSYMGKKNTTYEQDA